MNPIIFISFEFPPLTLGGVFRSLKFAKYLPDFGIQPHVYTLDPAYFHKMYPEFKSDNNLLEELKHKDVVIHPVPIKDVYKINANKISKFIQIYFTIYRSNEYKKWEAVVLDKIKKDAASVQFKAVLVTAPPFGMINIGQKIAAELKLPLILDMRDAWSLWTNVPYGSIFHYAITRSTEYKHFSFASKIIATTPQTIEDWKQLHPSIDSNKYTCIYNGYDDEDGKVDLHPFSFPPLLKDKTVAIAYVGSFYYSPEIRKQMMKPFYRRKGLKMLHYSPRKQDWLYRSPYFFFKTLQAVFTIDPSLKKQVKIIFAGRKEPWLMDMINEFSLNDNTEHVGFVSHTESLKIQQEADALLITSAKLVGGKDCFIAGKTFEYLTMNKPILGFVAEGAQKELLMKSGTTVFFDPDNTDAAANDLINLLQNGKAFDPDIAYIKNFERKKLTSDLAEVIKQVINSK